MREGGFFEQKRSSPTSLVIVVAAHAAAIAALALAKMDMPIVDPAGPLTVRHIPINPDPPPIPPEPSKKAEVPPTSRITAPPRRIETPTISDLRVPATEPTDLVTLDPYIGVAEKPRIQPLPPTPPPLPVPDPVRVEARLKSGIELLPPYPASEERAQAEGSVTVRLLIGADGRVKAAERIAAASDAFWRATERHALRAWRFTPATVDGRPVESRRTMTVHFELRG